MNTPVFVTGASGFIGLRLIERLVGEGRLVRALCRRPLPAGTAGGVEQIRGDLHDGDALRRGCAGASTVFHVAGRVGIWGSVSDFYRTNVEGTANIIACARAAGVSRFVHTSSPSVVYNGGPLAGMDESAPLCTRAPCAYPTTKAAAERLVAEANGPDFTTVSLRPHLVFGRGDTHLVPRLLELARRGRLRIVGNGGNLVDITPVENVVDAHLLAEKAAGIGGRAYFITNGEPVVLWKWINHLLRRLAVPEVTRHVSFRTAYAAGGVLENFWRIFRLRGDPPMTRFAAKELATDHWFRIDAARRDLGYAPRVSVSEATDQLVGMLAGR